MSDADVRAYHGLLDHHARRLDGWDEAEYDDLYQEGALEVIEALMRGSKPAKATIVGRMRRWVAKCRQRGITHVPAGRSGMYVDDDMSDLRDSLSEQVVSESRLEEITLSGALDALPKSERQAIELHVFRGLTFREAANAVGMSKDKIHRDYHDGIGRMRATLTTGQPLMDAAERSAVLRHGRPFSAAKLVGQRG